MLKLVSCLSDFYKNPKALTIEKLTHKSLYFKRLFISFDVSGTDEMIEIIRIVSKTGISRGTVSISDLFKDVKEYLKKNKPKEQKLNRDIVNYLKSIKFKNKAWENQEEYSKIAAIYKRHFYDFAMDAIQEVLTRYISAHESLLNLEPSYFKSIKTIYSIKRNQKTATEKEVYKNQQQLVECKFLMDKILNSKEDFWVEEVNNDILYVRELTKEIFTSVHEKNIAEDDFEDKIIDWADTVIRKLALSGKIKLYFLLQIKFAPLVREMDYDEWQDVVAGAALEKGISKRYFHKLKSRLKVRKDHFSGDVGLSFISIGIEQEIFNLLNRVDVSNSPQFTNN